MSDNMSDTMKTPTYATLLERLNTHGDKVTKLAKKRDDSNRQMKMSRKRLEDEINLSERLGKGIEQLNGLAGEAVAESKNAYEGYKNSLRKRMGELEASQAAITTLRDTVIPNLQAESAQAEKDLDNAIEKLVQSTIIPAVEAEMSDLLGQVVALHDDCLDASRDFAAQFRMSFACGRADNLPNASHDRIARARPRLIIGRSAEERAARIEQHQLRPPK